MPAHILDNLRAPAGHDVLDMMAEIFGMATRPGAPDPQHSHPLDETIGETVEKIEAAALSLLMLRDGIHGALLRGEDPEAIMRQAAASVRRTRTELGALLWEIE